MDLLVQEMLPFEVSGNYEGGTCACMCMCMHSEPCPEDLCTMYLLNLLYTSVISKEGKTVICKDEIAMHSNFTEVRLRAQT